MKKNKHPDILEILYEIKILINKHRMQVMLFRKKHPNLETLSKLNYLWIVHVGGIILKAEDLLHLVELHLTKKQVIKSIPYTILRVIHEDYLYLKSILSDSDLEKISIRFDSLVYKSERSQLSLLNSLVDLSKKGKFNPTDAFDEGFLESNIEKTKKEILILEEKNKENIYFKEKNKVYEKIIEMCKDYDIQKEINKVKTGEEMKSLEYQYNFLYRFKSMFTHQSLRIKEDIFRVFWKKKNYGIDNTEILGLLRFILQDIKYENFEEK